LAALLNLKGDGPVEMVDNSSGNSSSSSSSSSAGASSGGGGAAGKLDSRQACTAPSHIAAAASLALQHPRLLCFSPRGLSARFTALQAVSGLPAAAVAASVRAHPQMLVDAAAPEGDS
jgi:hypothetical protein